MRFRSVPSNHLLPLALLGLAVACGPSDDAERVGEGGPGAASPGASSVADVLLNGAEPYPGVWVGGQPSPEQLEAASRAGVQTVINLRRAGERGTKGEQQRVEGLGMKYVSVPITDAEDFDEKNAKAFSRALDAAERPVIVHCASGARVGALFAMRAFYVEGASAEEALAVGRAAGIGRYEEDVRKKLEGAEPQVRRKGEGKAGARKAKAGAKKGGKKGGKKGAKKDKAAA